MLRTLAIVLTVLLALPALAHTYAAPDCEYSVGTLDCDMSVAGRADLLDDSGDREESGVDAQQHCLLHCAAIASVFEFDCWFEPGFPAREPSIELLLHHGERIPRPPDLV